DDVAGAAINWDDGAGAGAATSESWTPPEAVALVDMAITTGGAQTRLQFIQDSRPTGDMTTHVVQVDTSPGRPALGIPFRAGGPIKILQLA
ncbi:unnamed protein product, partial [marine sediment metagenome]